MNPIVLEVLLKQIRSLRRIYLVMLACILAIVVATLALGPPGMTVVHSSTLYWAELGLALLAILLVGLVMPLARRRLLDPERVRTAEADMLKAWGLSEQVEPTIGRQAVYLTRYTAGCVISWGLAASVGLYGLVAGMLGAHAAVTGLFLAASIFTLLLLPPRGEWLKGAMEKL
jgi:hypothetical protein